MVSVMHDRVSELPRQDLRKRFLPEESPLPMSTQQLRSFQHGSPRRENSGLHAAPAHLHIRTVRSC